MDGWIDRHDNFNDLLTKVKELEMWMSDLCKNARINVKNARSQINIAQWVRIGGVGWIFPIFYMYLGF